MVPLSVTTGRHVGVALSETWVSQICGQAFTANHYTISGSAVVLSKMKDPKMGFGAFFLFVALHL